MAKNVSKNMGKALDFAVNIASAAASKIPQAALLTLPRVINFYQAGKGLYLENFVFFSDSTSSVQNKDYTYLTLQPICATR